MTKKELVKFNKEKLRMARDLKVMATTNMNIAERMESEAKNALAGLGARLGHKKQYLTEEQKEKLRAQILL